MAQNDTMTGDITPSVRVYEDFYDLLGVSDEASENEIELVARKLLARFHPDVSDHEDADAIFKDVNRAQNVLTDSEQRMIYDNLGHDQYIRRREKGELSLSEEFKDAVRGQATTTVASGEAQDGPRTTSPHPGRRDPEDAEGWTENFRQAWGYETISEFDLDISLETLVKRTYEEAWAIRLISIALIAGALYRTGSTNPELVLSTWQSIPRSPALGLGATVLSVVVSSSVLVTILTGLFEEYRIPIVEPVEEEETQSTREKHGDRSRGFNNSVSRQRSDSETRHSLTGPSRFDNNDGEKDTEDGGHEQKNGTIRHGKWFLWIGTVMIALGAFIGVQHPWGYLDTLLTGFDTSSPLWLDIGSESITEVVLLVNAFYVLLMYIVCISGVILVAHGISKETWYARYVDGSRGIRNAHPVVWDSAIVLFVSAFATGFALSDSRAGVIPFDGLPLVLRNIVIVETPVTLTSISVAALLGLLATLHLYGLRKRL
jgi:hypothetical protein